MQHLLSHIGVDVNHTDKVCTTCCYLLACTCVLLLTLNLICVSLLLHVAGGLCGVYLLLRMVGTLLLRYIVQFVCYMFLEHLLCVVPNPYLQMCVRVTSCVGWVVRH
jgi:hypothetical protein